MLLTPKTNKQNEKQHLSVSMCQEVYECVVQRCAALVLSWMDPSTASAEKTRYCFTNTMDEELKRRAKTLNCNASHGGEWMESIRKHKYYIYLYNLYIVSIYRLPVKIKKTQH